MPDPVPAGSTVGFYGDSLSFGLGARTPANRWSSLLCARRGWLEVNPGVSGIGFVNARAGTDLRGTLIAAVPALVIVALGPTTSCCEMICRSAMVSTLA